MRNRFRRLRFPIPGRRIALNLPARRYLPEVVRLLNDRSVARWTSHIPHPYRASDGNAWIRRAEANRRSGRDLSLVILRRKDGRLLGGASLHHLHDGSATGELGYWIGREFRGEGYASEAVRKMLSVGFRQLGLHRVEALIFPGNRASERLAVRCGFRYEGRIRDEIQKSGRWRDSLLYARLATDAAVRYGRRGRPGHHSSLGRRRR